jgi:DNA-binding MltR family transcriptional regulator
MADDWTSALRKLTREPPSKEVTSAVLNSMRGGDSDRGAALTMASLADTALNGIILWGTGVKEIEAIRGLFMGDRAPFGTFDAKIKVAWYFGLIGPKAYSNLAVIREVRNVFAHAMSDVTFDDKAIMRACERLQLSEQSTFFCNNVTDNRNRHKFGYVCDEIYRASFRVLIGFVTGHGLQRRLPEQPALP